MTVRIWFVIAATALAVAAAVLSPALPQPLDYHLFADRRAAFGIPNFLNVASNAAFLVVGIGGLVATLGRRARFEFGAETWPYVCFFSGVLLTAAGSAYYHLAPDNGTLFWDRLPMTIAFMALICSQIGERIDLRAGLLLLVPALLIGAASVVYWRATERDGAGNVMPYAVLQGYAIALMLLVARIPSRYTRAKLLYWVFAWYVLSKLLEALDYPIFDLGHAVSGHTLKHLAAAAAGAVVWRMLTHRTVA